MKKALIIMLIAAFFLIALPSCNVNINRTDNDNTDAAEETDTQTPEEFPRDGQPIVYTVSDEGILTVSMQNDSGDPDAIWYYTEAPGPGDTGAVQILSADNTGGKFTSEFAGTSDGSASLTFILSRDDELYETGVLDVTVSGGVITEAKASPVTVISAYASPEPPASEPAPETAPDTAPENEAPRTPSLLPAYYYSGSDEHLGVICAYLTATYAPNYAGDIQIPAPVIYKTDDSDPSYLKVWGRFLIDSYNLNGHALDISGGGEVLGMFTLRKTGAGFEVESFEAVSDGYDKSTDIRRICEGDESLVNRFYKSHASDSTAARVDYVSAYVSANSLEIDRYRDMDGTEHMLWGVPVLE
ncbi:MAG: hypothetical protein IIY34_03405 [Clostridia bacterium]|nr:hypothetical protein [Clostridia bacterium]